jgi:hypothetical protein
MRHAGQPFEREIPDIGLVALRQFDAKRRILFQIINVGVSMIGDGAGS